MIEAVAAEVVEGGIVVVCAAIDVTRSKIAVDIVKPEAKDILRETKM